MFDFGLGICDILRVILISVPTIHFLQAADHQLVNIETVRCLIDHRFYNLMEAGGLLEIWRGMVARLCLNQWLFLDSSYHIIKSGP